MTALPARIATALACCTAAAAASSLRFANDDVITGTPRSIGIDRLVWESPLLEQPAEFFTDRIIDLSLPAEVPEEKPDHIAVITLTNGDTVRGQLASITDEEVTLDTWFAGRMSFNRLMVSGLEIEESAASLYNGPSGIDGWTQSADPPAWTYTDSSFRSSRNGGIARDDLLVEECSVKFDCAWKGDSIRLRVIVFSDDPSTDNPDDGYEITFQRGRVHARNLRTQNFLGSAQSQALMENDRVSVEIRASSKTQRIALLIDDEPIEVWNDPDAGKANHGGALHFISNSTVPMKISRIRVIEWDGEMDRMPDPQIGFQRFRFGGEPDEPPVEPAEEEDAEDRIQLANGDSLPGTVKSITEGLVSIETPLGEIELPVSRLRSLALKSVDAERCKRYRGDVRAWFPDGGSVVFRLEDSGPGTFTGYSQNFGRATFKSSAFSRIEFNIHSLDYQQRSAADGW
ncbi:MAG TPA: hypothetical protein VLO11_04645 [Luteolibacter sp.]|nr:hypothetical protein [Luteolibacter sp.]